MPTLEDALIAGAGHAAPDATARDRLERALEASPDLNANLGRALAEGHLRAIRFEDPAAAGAGGQYDYRTQSLSVPPAGHHSLADTIFVLGHETQHALSLQGRRPHYETRLEEDVAQAQIDQAELPSKRTNPRDYTLPVYDCIDGTRREEAQAHIGGFNAVASYLTKRKNGEPPSLRDMYEALPGRMGDFIETTGVAPRLDYRLKDGLTLAKDGRLEPTEANIDAMKRHYADKFPGTFGPNGLLDYRHTTLTAAWEHIHDAEQRRVDAWNKANWPAPHGAPPPPDYGYRIDFEALGANPAVLKFPHDGIVRLTDKAKEHDALDRMGAGPRDARRNAIETDFSPLRDAIRPRDDAQYMLREQGTLPRDFSDRIADAFRTAPNAGELTPNRVNHPAQLRAPAPGPLALDADTLAALAPRAAAAPTARTDADPMTVQSPLVAQARTELERLQPLPLPPSCTPEKRNELLENLAAGLAFEAQRAGLDRIDRIYWNRDNDLLIAVQGDPNSQTERHIAANHEALMERPAAQSLSALSALAHRSDALGQERRPEAAQEISATPTSQDTSPAQATPKHAHQ